MIIDPYRFNSEDPELLRRVAFGFNSTDLSACATQYTSLEKDATEIENICGVGESGICEMVISYVNSDVQLQETIFVDTTLPSIFWTDILNWCYLNNYPGITYHAPTNTYIIDDPMQPTYLLISLA